MKFTSPFLLFTLSLLLLTGCLGPSKIGDISKAIGDKPGMTKVGVGSIYGKGDYLHINPSLNHSYTVAPDGTVTIKAADHPYPPMPASPTAREIYGR